ncbi:MAG: hypothetical protein ABIJ65_04085 [Chloroflexota bacterium]
MEGHLHLLEVRRCDGQCKCGLAAPTRMMAIVGDHAADGPASWKPSFGNPPTGKNRTQIFY